VISVTKKYVEETRGATLNELAVTDCEALLRRCSVGRLAVEVPGTSPLVVPVNYVMDGPIIVFRSAAGQKLAHIHNRMVSFEIDEIDHFHRSGWSVLVRGMAEATVDLGNDGTAVDSWTNTPKMHVVRINPSKITGRVLVMPPAAISELGYL
jgi:nitroimidazol reductase NimA-like FMN-containing flavoprotein (pyridoxamine 5'-phosphate oxidase superfamily)